MGVAKLSADNLQRQQDETQMNAERLTRLLEPVVS
ncbi:ribosome maturation factor RimP, partial [Escherichia coli]